MTETHSPGGNGRLLLQGGVLADGSRADIAISPDSGLITDVQSELYPWPQDTVEDCTGMTVLASPAEPHSHLAQVFTLAPNPAGDLDGALRVYDGSLPKMSVEDIFQRATRAVETMVANGTTAIRTHIPVGPEIGLRAVEALTSVRTAFDGLLDLQLVAVAPIPAKGSDETLSLRLVAEALEAGADVVGGLPYRHPDPRQAISALLDLAQSVGCLVDFHTDETLDAAVVTVADLARQVADRGMAHRVTASHCVSLGMQTAHVQTDIAKLLAHAGVSVVTCPLTNLFLQARDIATAPSRGMTAVSALRKAGVTLAAGGDNARDPFNSMGRFDATEVAALMVMAGHLTPEQAWQCCSDAARTVMGLAPVAIRPGFQAEIVVLSGLGLTEAVAAGAGNRLTIHRGHVVARTTTTRTLSVMPNFVET